MKNDYIYIKLNKKSEIVLKDSCNKIVFTGITDNYGNIKVPICNNNLYITEKQSSYQCKCLKNKIIEYSIDNVDDIKSVYINNELKIKII